MDVKRNGNSDDLFRDIPRYVRMSGFNRVEVFLLRCMHGRETNYVVLIPTPNFLKNDTPSMVYLNKASAEIYNHVHFNPRKRTEVSLWVLVIQLTSKAIEHEPRSHNAYMNRGDTYRRLGLWEKALRDFEKCIKLELSFRADNTGWPMLQFVGITPELPGYITRGCLFLEMGKLHSALQDFISAANSNPKSWKAYYYQGVVFVRTEDVFSLQISVDLFLEALKRNEKCNKALIALKYVSAYTIGIRRSTLSDKKTMDILKNAPDINPPYSQDVRDALLLLLQTPKRPSRRNSLCPVCTTIVKKTRACTGCNAARYCSTDCQKKDWGEHKKICKSLGMDDSFRLKNIAMEYYLMQFSNENVTEKIKKLMKKWQNCSSEKDVVRLDTKEENARDGEKPNQPTKVKRLNLKNRQRVTGCNFRLIVFVFYLITCIVVVWIVICVFDSENSEVVNKHCRQHL